MAKRETPADFKKQSLREDTRSQRVYMWKKRIERAEIDLMISQRVDNAREADRFLGGGKEAPTRGNARARAYQTYASPLWGERHRTSTPTIPTPVAKARTEAAAGFNNQKEQETQRFLSYIFDKNEENIMSALDAVQWDDDKMGASILRVDWKQETVDASPTSNISEEDVAVQRNRAAEENLDPLQQTITDSDNDLVHLRVHKEFLATLDPASPAYNELSQHILEHNSRLTVVTKEGIRVERVRNDRYVYDQYNTWAKRGWEAELKFARAKHLIENGYKNVNPMNAPARQSTMQAEAQSHQNHLHSRASSGEIAYEDKTIAIWEIHDRLNDKELVISADGPDDGLPLMERPWRYGKLDIYKLRPFHAFEPSQSWGEPLMHVMNPILNELAIVDYYIQRHVQNHPTPKILVPGKAGAGKIKKGLRDPNQGVIEIPVDSAGLTIFNPPAIPKALLEQRQSLVNELRRAVGLDAQDIGAANPAAITATESFARSQAGAGRIEDRQKVMASFLSWIGEMAMELYKQFAMMAVEVSVNTEFGQEWTTIQPRDLPVDVDISFDIESVTDRGRAENIARVDRVLAIAAGSPVPVDYDKLMVWAFRELGIRRPEQFRVPGPTGPENVLDVSGQPGIEGGDQAPVGTALNTRAQTEFAPGPSQAAAAAESAGQTVS